MTTDYLSLTFAALADPTRRAILARLAQPLAVGGSCQDLTLPGEELTSVHERFLD